MTVLVDTNVWSLSLRRDAPGAEPVLAALINAVEDGELILTTGLVLQELLLGELCDSTRQVIAERVEPLPEVRTDVLDHIAAAEIQNVCRRVGVQIGIVDAVLAQLCIRHGLRLLTADRDFEHVARITELQLYPVAA